MRTICAALLCVIAASPLHAQESTDPDIGSFRMGKVSLNTTLADFKKLYPQATKTKDSDPKLGLEVYDVEPAGMFGIFVYFLDGMPWQIQGLWFDEQLSKIGGYNTILDNITDKYGKAHEDSPGVKSEEPYEAILFWRADASKKLLTFQMKDEPADFRKVVKKYVCVQIFNLDLRDMLQERQRKTAKSGLDD